MFDINIKNVKKGRRFFYIFLVVGLLFIIIFVGIFVYPFAKKNILDSKILSTRVEIKSHISDKGNRMYSSTYYYRVNGKEYNCSSSISTAISPETQNRIVYYDSQNPSNCVTGYSKNVNYMILLLLLVPIPFVVIAVVNIRKVNKRIKIIIELNQNGRLVKNLPYRLENTNMSVNGIPIQRPVIDYTLSTGITVTLYGDARHDGKRYDEDGMVDLLIDESNPENYYIDFEINRLGGNLPQDYYQSDYQNALFKQYNQEQSFFDETKYN